MALTQISTAGVKDDAVTSGKIPANAVGSSEIAANAVGASELADNAVDTAAIADDAVTFDKIAHIPTARIVGRSTSGTGTLEAMTASTLRTVLNVADGATNSPTTTINNNANNRIITGSDTANTLEGESTLLWDGSILAATGSDAQLRLLDNSGPTSSAFRLMAYNGVNMIQSGQAYSSDSKADLVFGSMFGGSEFMRLDTSGNLGINESTPDRKLHVKSGANNNDGALRVESATGNIMDMGTDGTGHFINCVNADPFRVKFGGTEKARFLAGGGITFNGDTATANALDDYEEGNWTPTGSGFTVSSVISARYTKVGRLVTINAYVNAATGTGASAVVITNLPFSQYGNSNYHYGSGRIGSAGGNTNSQNNIVFQIQQNSNSAKIYVNDGGINEQMISGQHIIFSATYEAA